MRQKYIQCMNTARILHHISALSCLHGTQGPAADLGVNLRVEVKQKARGSLGGRGERQGRNADQGEMERPELLCSPVQHLIRKKETPSILNPPVPHTNTQTAHREQQIDTFFLIKGKGSGLCAMPAHSKH